MPLSFFAFLDQLTGDPALALIVLLTLAVLLVNGWTDAPNAIAGVVVTGALPFPCLLYTSRLHLFSIPLLRLSSESGIMECTLMPLAKGVDTMAPIGFIQNELDLKFLVLYIICLLYTSQTG